MRLIRRNTETEEFEARKYPTAIDRPVIGQPANIKWYKEVTDPQPEYDHRTHKLVKSETWTTDPWDGHDHIFIKQVTYQTEQLTNEQIIEKLNTELGNHLDTLCPIWKRTKYNTEGVFFLELMTQQVELTSAQQARITYLKSVQTWFDTCRAERDAMEADLLGSDTLPDFNFSPYPTES